MANVDASTDRVNTYTIKQDMENAGYTRLATQLALTRLARMQFVEASEDSDMNGSVSILYRMLEAGENWLLENQEKLELRIARNAPNPSREQKSLSDDDIPF
jgi:DNA-binding PadR family transcriptional regulator